MNLKKSTKIRLSTGHLLVLWDVIANKLSGSPFIDTLNEEERRALWALQDFSEAQILKLGIGPKPETEWKTMMAAARRHVGTFPVEFVD